jgi:hypothetical protein
MKRTMDKSFKVGVKIGFTGFCISGIGVGFGVLGSQYHIYQLSVFAFICVIVGFAIVVAGMAYMFKNIYKMKQNVSEYGRRKQPWE